MEIVLRENHGKIESKSLEFTILLYICYDEHEAPISCNNIVYLSKSNGPKHLHYVKWVF